MNVASQNPYESPRTEASVRHETYVRRFPLAIRQSRRVRVFVRGAELEDRMRHWALDAGYRLNDSDQNRRIYQRGSFLKGLFAWDVRDLRSTVAIVFSRSSTIDLDVELSCHSRIGVVKPGDVRRLVMDLDLLESHLGV